MARSRSSRQTRAAACMAFSGEATQLDLLQLAAPFFTDAPPLPCLLPPSAASPAPLCRRGARRLPASLGGRAAPPSLSSLRGEPCAAPSLASCTTPLLPPSAASPAPLLCRRAVRLLPCLPRRGQNQMPQCGHPNMNRYFPAALIPSCNFIYIQTIALIL